MEGLRELIIIGVLAPDDRLPSVRELATDLVINPNTIQRAYRELEAQGYIASIPGKGSFACAQNNIVETRPRELLRRYDDIVTELLYLGVTPEELKSRIDEKEDAGNDKV